MRRAQNLAVHARARHYSQDRTPSAVGQRPMRATLGARVTAPRGTRRELARRSAGRGNRTIVVMTKWLPAALGRVVFEPGTHLLGPS